MTSPDAHTHRADLSPQRVGEAFELVLGTFLQTSRLAPMLSEAFEVARAACRERLDASMVDVHVLVAPDECIPQWGIGGYAYGPHALLVAVDLEHDIKPEHLVATLVHEVHHAIRWRGPGCGTSLGERLVSEGLAEVFEEECTGQTPIYATTPTEPAARALAWSALDESPADEGRWFFGAKDLPWWFGYSMGYELVKERLRLDGVTAAQAVAWPASHFLDRPRLNAMES